MSGQPDYVSFEPNGREELLSRIGSFSALELALFQRLCDSWAPQIDVDRLLRPAGANLEQERTALDRLMARLRIAEIGVMTTKEGDSGREPDQVILTSKGSPGFWAAVLNEAIGTLLTGDFRILPSEQRMRERKALPPDYHLVEANSSQLVEAYGGAGEPETLYRMRLMASFRILFTAESARPLILRGLSVLKRDLIERGIVEEIARLKDTTISELRKRLESKAPDVWLDLSRTVVKERATIAFRKNLDEHDELFQLAYLIMVFVDAQVGVAREQKELRNRIDGELEAVADAVLRATAGSLSQEEFSILVDEARTRLEGDAGLFATRLAEELLAPRPRRKLARVVYLHGVYIHRDRIRSVFDLGRHELHPRLTGEYIELMEAFLRGRAPEIGELFGSRELLNDDIARRVERLHPLIGELIARPQLFAEAIIQDTKQRREGVSTEELKGVLADYFDVDSSALHPLSELFGLNIVTIFDEAFAQNNVFRQLLLRLSGRYESLRATYSRRFGPRSQNRRSFVDTPGVDDAPGAGRRVAPVRPDDDDAAGLRIRTPPGRTGRSESAGSTHPRSSARPAKPQAKSRSEIEQIWQDFDRALHTKPSKEDPT